MKTDLNLEIALCSCSVRESRIRTDMSERLSSSRTERAAWAATPNWLDLWILPANGISRLRSEGEGRILSVCLDV